jgi:glycosyltransferase involved in cell wall biosynthesis
MRLQWASNWDMVGNGFGYSMHQKMLRAGLEKLGVEVIDSADVAVHIVVPTGFTPIPGKFNVLYTMYEGETIPEDWIQPLQFADLIVVPCSHNVHVFRKYTDRPIEVCLEGVDIEKFPFVERKAPVPPEAFLFLYNGASNPRKGYEHVALAWEQFWRKYPKEFARSWLFMKTTQSTRAERSVNAKDAHCTVDTRKYSVENLAQLYASANCFLFPSMGEGFGLTLAEAMCTGLPCIYTPWSGPKDFITEREGYPLRFKMFETRTVKTEADGSRTDYHRTTCVSADIDHLVRRMVQVIHGYDEALTRGRRAAEVVRDRLKWSDSALSFARIMEKYTAERLVEPAAIAS